MKKWKRDPLWRPIRGLIVNPLRPGIRILIGLLLGLIAMYLVFPRLFPSDPEEIAKASSPLASVLVIVEKETDNVTATPQVALSTSSPQIALVTATSFAPTPISEVIATHTAGSNFEESPEPSLVPNAIAPSATTVIINLYKVVLHPEGHSSENWAENRTNPSPSYPAVQPYYTNPNGPKASIKWTPEMLKYLENLQIDFKAYKEILWIAGGIFNVQGNQEYLPDKRVPDTRYYIPANGPWPTLPISQPVTSINNLVNSLEMRKVNGVWWHRIETIPVGLIPNFTHLEKPWLFNNPFTSIATEGNQIGNAIDSRGVIVPLYSKAEAWIPETVLEKIN